MKIIYDFQGVYFEWDDNKALRNIQKHGVRFEEACEVFLDPFVKTLDSEVIDLEERDTIVGMTENWHVLSVVLTVKENDIFRLISARRATSNQRKIYEKQ